MKFKSTLALSVLLHASLAAVFIVHPAKKTGGQMTYYVDLVSLGNGGGGGGRGTGGGGVPQETAAREADAGATLVEERAGRVRDLTVAKEFKSPLRYPDAESRKKVEEEKMVSVVRKERPVPASAAATATAGAVGPGGLKTGISSGGVGPGGGGGGWGDGSGGSGGGFFPHAYYVELLRSRISSSWYNSLVAPGLKGKYVSGVYFVIHRNGVVSDLKVERPSGVPSLDLSARRAIENSAPFAPLPDDFSSQYLVVHFEFEWEKQ